MATLSCGLSNRKCGKYSTPSGTVSDALAIVWVFAAKQKASRFRNIARVILISSSDDAYYFVDVFHSMLLAPLL